jgi:hypothetical protein
MRETKVFFIGMILVFKSKAAQQLLFRPLNT